MPRVEWASLPPSVVDRLVDMMAQHMFHLREALSADNRTRRHREKLKRRREKYLNFCFFSLKYFIFCVLWFTHHAFEVVRPESWKLGFDHGS